MNLTDAQIQNARDLAVRLNLSGKELLLNNSNALIRRVCNGIGPTRMAPQAREALGWFLPSLLVPAMIHDLRYYYGSGTYADFHAANEELAFNARLVARHLYPWWRPRRYAAWLASWQAGRLCDLHGWRSYIAAMDERQDWEDRAGMELTA